MAPFASMIQNSFPSFTIDPGGEVTATCCALIIGVAPFLSGSRSEPPTTNGESLKAQFNTTTLVADLNNTHNQGHSIYSFKLGCNTKQGEFDVAACISVASCVASATDIECGIADEQCASVAGTGEAFDGSGGNNGGAVSFAGHVSQQINSSSKRIASRPLKDSPPLSALEQGGKSGKGRMEVVYIDGLSYY
ncbi:MAG: hypothetical protein EZS28_020636 [Streblomastix strix]|uniref:Uncharacterized protein n=1 Tax=Streblomastix strix TaxID=222440 RepID=A0A5J4VNE6_9EUKA|nr:MAG: hypothetical protein EZS28_020636 [Streblomastix strix]